MHDSRTPPSQRDPRRGVRALLPRPRVLLAEDDAEWRTLIAGVLRADGYEVIEAHDGGRLLVLVGRAYFGRDRNPEDAYDALVSDIRMPICTGLKIVEALRRANWHFPVILMTAFGDDTTHARAKELAAVIFDKPFDLDDLRTALLNLVPPDAAKRP